MKDESTGVSIKEFLRLKPKIYSFSRDGTNECEEAKGVNRNVAAKINHNEYKNVFMNNKCLRHTMNRIIYTINKYHRIGTYEISKTSLSCFDSKI